MGRFCLSSWGGGTAPQTQNPCPSTSTKTNQLFKMLKHLHRAFYVPGSILNTLCTVILQFCEAGAIHIPTLQMEKKKSKYREFMSPTVKKLLLTTSNTKIFFKKSVYFSYSFVLMKPYYTTSFKKFIWLHQVFTGACGIQFPDWRLKPRPPGL